MSQQGESRTVEIHGYAMRVIREARGQSTVDLAHDLNVDRSYITKIETGHSRRVGKAFYSRLLVALHIDDYRALLAMPPERDVEIAS